MGQINTDKYNCIVDALENGYRIEYDEQNDEVHKVGYIGRVWKALNGLISLILGKGYKPFENCELKKIVPQIKHVDQSKDLSTKQLQRLTQDINVIFEKIKERSLGKMEDPKIREKYELVQDLLSILKRTEQVKSFLKMLSEGDLNKILQNRLEETRAVRFHVFFDKEGKISDVKYEPTLGDSEYQEISDLINKDYKKELGLSKEKNLNYFDILITPLNKAPVKLAVFFQNEKFSPSLEPAKNAFIKDLNFAFQQGYKSFEKEKNWVKVATDPSFKFEIK